MLSVVSVSQFVHRGVGGYAWSGPISFCEWVGMPGTPPVHPLEGTQPLNGQYASYWNAFLLQLPSVSSLSGNCHTHSSFFFKMK